MNFDFDADDMSYWVNSFSKSENMFNTKKKEDMKESLAERGFYILLVTKNVKNGKYKTTNKKTGEYTIGAYIDKVPEGIFETYTRDGKQKYEDYYENGMIQEKHMYKPSFWERNKLVITESRFYKDGHLVKRESNDTVGEIQKESFNIKGEFEGKFVRTKDGSVTAYFYILNGCFVGDFYTNETTLEMSFEGKFDESFCFPVFEADEIESKSYYRSAIDKFENLLFGSEIFPYLNGFYRRTFGGFAGSKRCHEETKKGICFKEGEKWVSLSYFEHGNEISLKEYNTKAIANVANSAFGDVKAPEILNIIKAYKGY